MLGIFQILSASMLLFLVSAFKNGAPAHVCLSPYPHHKPFERGENFEAQPLESSPVKIELSNDTYGSSNKSIKILIRNVGEQYRGLLMLIRSTIPVTRVPIGQFTFCNSTAIKFLKAASDRNNCLTHKDSHHKPSTIMCVWQPPYLENYGDLELVISVVHNFSVFWVDQTYPIKYDNVRKLPYNYPSYMIPHKDQASQTPSSAIINGAADEQSIKSNVQITAFQISKCGIERHCLLYPPNCKLTSSCQYMVNIEDLGSRGVSFELVAPLNGYLGFGISPHDRRAHEALVTVCRTNGKSKVVSLYSGDTHKHFLFEDPKEWITDRHTGVDRNWMGKIAKICRYRIATKDITFNTKAGKSKVSLTDDLYYYFAVGKMFGETNYIVAHSQNPLKTNGKINLLKSEYSTHYLSSFVIAEKFHATIMVLAWVLLIPIGTMIPRYFKSVWTMTYVQKVLWLLSHMVAVISGVLLSIISYILIIVINHGWRKAATLHGVFGSLTILAGLINIAIGFNRPDPKSERRKLFNNVHFLVAVLSKLFSYLTFWFILVAWGMRSEFIVASCIINGLWNFLEICFYCSSFIFQKDRKLTNIFANKQFNPPNWFLIGYFVLECLIAVSFISNIWLN